MWLFLAGVGWLWSRCWRTQASDEDSRLSLWPPRMFRPDGLRWCLPDCSISFDYIFECYNDVLEAVCSGKWEVWGQHSQLQNVTNCKFLIIPREIFGRRVCVFKVWSPQPFLSVRWCFCWFWDKSIQPQRVWNGFPRPTSTNFLLNNITGIFQSNYNKRALFFNQTAFFSNSA